MALPDDEPARYRAVRIWASPTVAASLTRMAVSTGIPVRTRYAGSTPDQLARSFAVPQPSRSGDLTLTKRMPKTLAAEIASRTLAVVNPANRAVALLSTLRRHGFDTDSTELPASLADRSELITWLLVTYAPRE